MAAGDKEFLSMLRFPHDSTRPRLALALILAGACFTEVTGSQRKLRGAQMTGKITGNDLEADIGTDLCAGHLSLKK